MARASTSQDLRRLTRATPEIEDEPSAKRRKLGISVSFADVLEGMAKKGGVNTGAEGGSDRWPRPPLPRMDEEINPIIFQQIDVQESVDSNGVSIIRMFGVTEAGNSVLAHITDFLPYFYVPVPRGFTSDDLEPLADHLNSKINGNLIRDIQIKGRYLQRCDERILFLKIKVAEPGSVSKVRDLTFESNIDYALRFMIDLKVVGMNWIKVPAGKYRFLSNDTKISHCQLEFNVRYNDFISYPPNENWAKLAPLRILSFDIECEIRGKAFPDASIDSVIQIANMVTRRGEQEPFIRNVFTLGSCSPIEGLQILSYADESKLLQGWSDFVNQVDPDVVIGYNIARFDLPYLFGRSKTLKMGQFSPLGRLNDLQAPTTNIPQWRRDWKDAPTLDGRLILDVMYFIVRNFVDLPKNGGYKLGSVATRFLDQNKEDVDFSIITELQNGTPDTRRRLAIYCSKDAYLPQRLMDKLMCLDKCVENSRAAGVSFNALMMREHLVNVSRLFRTAKHEGYLISDS